MCNILGKRQHAITECLRVSMASTQLRYAGGLSLAYSHGIILFQCLFVRVFQLRRNITS